MRGRLTIKEITREAEFTATVVALANQYVADATATVRMADYGIPYPRAFIFVARDPVTVTLHIVARGP
jgi:polyisoprenoid-binding protein YceI